MLRILLSLSLLLLSQNVWSTTVDRLRISRTDNDIRIVFDLSSDVKYRTFVLQNPDRIVLDLEDTDQPKKLLVPSLQDSVIKGIRYGVKGRNGLRIVVDLKRPLKYDNQKLAKEGPIPHRLVLDLHKASTGLNTKIKKNDPASKHPGELKPKSILMIKEPTASKKLKRRNIIIAIDAGHGGSDTGAKGHQGTKEKDVVLAIAKKLAKLVAAEPGMSPYLTRDKDVFIQLRHRIKRANYNHADMFISIHADAFKDKKAKGASVFVLSERGASSEAAQLLADKENAADLAGGISLDDKDSLLASVLLDLSQTASLEGSLEVANSVLAGLKRVGNVHKKYVESASFVVLKSPDIPSILVETAFISNPEEEQKLNNAAHQNKLARALMSGIRYYFQRNPLLETIQEQHHIVSRGDTLSTIAGRYQVTVKQLQVSNNLKSSTLKVGDLLVIP